MEKGASEQRVRGGFLAMNESSCLSQKTGSETTIAKSIGNPLNVGERAKFCSLHLRPAYYQEIRLPWAPFLYMRCAVLKKECLFRSETACRDRLIRQNAFQTFIENQ